MDLLMDGQSQRTSLVHRSPWPRLLLGPEGHRLESWDDVAPRKGTLKAAFARDVGLKR